MYVHSLIDVLCTQMNWQQNEATATKTTTTTTMVVASAQNFQLNHNITNGQRKND